MRGHFNQDLPSKNMCSHSQVWEMAMGKGNVCAKVLECESVWHTMGTMQTSQQEMGSRQQERRWSGDKGEKRKGRRP